MITGAIVSSLAAAAVSWLAGDVIGIMLGKSGIGGFGGVTAKTLRIGKLKRAIYDTDPTEQARKDLLTWCEENSEAAGTHRLYPSPVYDPAGKVIPEEELK